MAVDKIAFETAVISMKNFPSDVSAQNEYVNQVQQLTTFLFAKYKMSLSDKDDAMQDMMLQIFKKRLHEKIDPNGEPFAFYWSVITRDIWRMQREKYGFNKKEIIHKYDCFDYATSDEGEWEEDMLRELSFKLEDYQELTTKDLHRIPIVETGKPKRGRPSKEKKGAFAKHWEDMFNYLKENKQVTEKDLLNKLPGKKRADLINPENSVKYYMRNISNREGFKLTTTQSGIELIYILVGAD